MTPVTSSKTKTRKHKYNVTAFFKRTRNKEGWIQMTDKILFYVRGLSFVAFWGIRIFQAQQGTFAVATFNEISCSWHLNENSTVFHMIDSSMMEKYLGKPRGFHLMYFPTKISSELTGRKNEISIVMKWKFIS